MAPKTQLPEGSFEDLDLASLPLGESQIPEGKVWKFATKPEAQDFVNNFQPESLPDCSPQGMMIPLFFVAGGHVAVVYLFMLAYAQAHRR